MEAVGVVLVLVGLAMSIVSIVASVTILTKAGYSGWWILTQFVPAIVAWVLSIVVINVVVNRTGQPTLGKLFGADLIVIVIYAAAVIVQWGFFIAFAFSDWPALHVNRSGPGRRGPGSGSFGPSGPAPMGGAPTVSRSPAQGQPPGWQRTTPAASPETAPAPMTSSVSGPVPALPLRQAGRPLGWYPADDGSADECYWDGRSWVSRRRPVENGWIIVAM